MNVLNSLFNKRIIVLGLGMTGRACVRFLKQHQDNWNIQISAMDTRADITPDPDISCFLGGFDEAEIAAADVLVVSPGIDIETPQIAQAAAAGKWILGDIEIFALYAAAHRPDVPIIAVTGSNGKSTVVTLLEWIAKQAGKRVALGGNIGIPALELFEQEAELFILELSSFQLETTDSLQLASACILNLSEDHMDRYESLSDYVGAKQRIYTHSKQAVCLKEDALTHPLTSAHLSAADVDIVYISAQQNVEGWGLSQDKNSICFNSEPLLAAKDIQLVGVHNLLNIQAALVMSAQVGIETHDAIRAAKTFTGLPHRCQKVREVAGVTWINDSKATNVGACIAAIEGVTPSLKGRLFLIVGGDAKQADVQPLASVFNQYVFKLLCFGKDAALFMPLSVRSQRVTKLEEAVQVAANEAKAGDMVLLSPACASLDMFQSYMHRGNCFVEAVEAVA
ncbi:UDP-N-acetylmuramoyl-L-alanine--D-glutamate ligase [Alteromonas sp. a30]|uniref:UDP-N-acetylmuramoyl-L-alanine--D-glutamate ligase n=1 Tax=Alteromonas sp. a30 TaxID=2730917 RepID=UPI002281E709|nr:UDP-N-acetylmuramoyl-L-alanine--D-glutamate ligase [Alteromonas sp. a30]MCY7294251.1 UDP-N-acetylmuramoyl-L-alanine--D-glutamate ligase [Alteromonas sp. a30]